MSNELQLPTSRKSNAGANSAENFVTYKVYDAPNTEGGQPIWFANISFAKEQKEVAELYLQGLIDCGIHHSFLSAEEKVDRVVTSADQVKARFAKLMQQA
mgnify:CR=1 FL=1